jgi:hypothetical protein
MLEHICHNLWIHIYPDAYMYHDARFIYIMMYEYTYDDAWIYTYNMSYWIWIYTIINRYM